MPSIACLLGSLTRAHTSSQLPLCAEPLGSIDCAQLNVPFGVTFIATYELE